MPYDNSIWGKDSIKCGIMLQARPRKTKLGTKSRFPTVSTIARLSLGASLSSDLQEADVTIALPIVVPFWGYLIGFCI